MHMKKLWLSLFVLILVSARAQALGYYGDYISQLQTAVNNALTSATDPKALSALNKASNSLATVNASDVPAVLKTFSQASTGISKTSASNEVGATFQTILGYYIAIASGDALFQSNRLNGAFPSGTRNAALKNIGQVFGYLNGIGDSPNLAAAAKLVIKAANKNRVVTSLVDKALAVPPPPSQLSATISAPAPGGGNFSPDTVTATLNPGTHVLSITGVAITRKGLTVTVRSLFINIPDVTSDGTRNLGVTSSGSDANILYTVQQGSVGGGSSGDSYGATTGSVSVTINTAAKAAFGTFTFSGAGQNNSSATASSNDGSFSVIWQ